MRYSPPSVYLDRQTDMNFIWSWANLILHWLSDPSCLPAWATSYVLLVVMPLWSFHCHHSSFVIWLSSCGHRHAFFRPCGPSLIAWATSYVFGVMMSSWSLHRRHSTFVIWLPTCRRIHVIVATQSSSCRRHYTVILSLSSLQVTPFHCHNGVVVLLPLSFHRHQYFFVIVL